MAEAGDSAPGVLGATIVRVHDTVGVRPRARRSMSSRPARQASTLRSATPSQRYWAAVAAPRSRRRPARAGSVSTRAMAPAIAPGSVGSKRAPGGPGISPQEVVPEWTTGAPALIASTIGSPKPS